MNNLLNKKIVILGFGKEGKSTYNYLRSKDKEMVITIMDQNYQNISLDDPTVKIIDVDYNLLKDYDLIFKTPGISFKDVDITSFKDKITSELEYFLANSKAKTIGITGTKGKSTTTSLIYQILKDQNKNAYLLGNIGNPIFDEMDNIKEDSYAVIEMSSHQLQYVKHSPNIAIILNLHPEHLDHYKSLNEYYEAKLNIFKYQNSKDDFIYYEDNDVLENYVNNLDIKSNKYLISKDDNQKAYAYFEDNHIIVDSNKVFDITKNIDLKGKHNMIDIAFALSVSNILNLDLEKAAKTVEAFKGLPHRMEKVATINKVTYYNDSIATIPDATINAIETLKKVNTLILGGMDRGISYEEFINYLKTCNVENIICMPDTGNYIYDKLSGYKNVYKADDVKKAVEIAFKITKENMICLLSPAAPSYNIYKNFEQRGNAFKKALKEEENARTS